MLSTGAIPVVLQMVAVNDGVDTLVEGGEVYFAPEGQSAGNSPTLAYTGSQRVVQIVPVAGGVDTLFSGGDVYFSPDGRQLGGGGNSVPHQDNVASILEAPEGNAELFLLQENGTLEAMMPTGPVTFGVATNSNGDVKVYLASVPELTGGAASLVGRRSSIDGLRGFASLGERVDVRPQE